MKTKTWQEIRKPSTPEREAEHARWVAAEIERMKQQSSEAVECDSEEKS